MKSNLEIVQEVLDGKWGNGEVRRAALSNAGYDYNAIQYLVNKVVRGESIDPPEQPTPKDPNSTARLLNVEVDLSKYDGVTLLIVGVPNAEH